MRRRAPEQNHVNPGSDSAWQREHQWEKERGEEGRGREEDRGGEVAGERTRERTGETGPPVGLGQVADPLRLFFYHIAYLRVHSRATCRKPATNQSETS